MFENSNIGKDRATVWDNKRYQILNFRKIVIKIQIYETTYELGMSNVTNNMVWGDSPRVQQDGVPHP